MKWNPGSLLYTLAELWVWQKPKKKKKKGKRRTGWAFASCLRHRWVDVRNNTENIYPILCYRTAELYDVLCCCSLLTIQISFFSGEVCRKVTVKQTVHGWPRDSTYTVCSSVTEDFNCIYWFVVKLFIKRLPNYFIHLDSLISLDFKVYFISMT